VNLCSRHVSMVAQRFRTGKGGQRAAGGTLRFISGTSFSKTGELGPPPDVHNSVGVLCLKRAIPAGQSASFEFLLGGGCQSHARRIGWSAPEGEGKTAIGNSYAARFKDAWEAVSYTAAHLKDLEARTRMFTNALRESTLPAAVKEAAKRKPFDIGDDNLLSDCGMASFMRLRGSDDTQGCCFGNCTHVWNYETATNASIPFVCAVIAGEMRLDTRWTTQERSTSDSCFPMGKRAQDSRPRMDRWGRLSTRGWTGRSQAMRRSCGATWPRAKKALEFAWVPGGWDSNRDGVMEGVQHNTYDVEFYGPNPMCGIYYLGALRAGEEMARAVGGRGIRRDIYEGSSSREAGGSMPIFSMASISSRRFAASKRMRIAGNLRSDMGSENTENPEYQVGGGVPGPIS